MWNPIKEAKKAAKKAKRAAKKAAQETKKGVEKAARETKRLAEKAEVEVKQAAKKVEEETKKLFEQEVLQAVSSITDKIKKEVFDKVKKEVESLGESAKKGIEEEIGKIRKNAEEELKNAGNKIKKDLGDLPKLIEDAAKSIFEDLASIATKEGAKKICDLLSGAISGMEFLETSRPKLVDAINAAGFEIEIGPVTCSYAGFYSRSQELLTAIENFSTKKPSFRRSYFIGMLRDLGPDEVDLGISIQIIALVVASKELGIGGKLKSLQLDLALELLDIVLKEIGVPA